MIGKNVTVENFCIYYFAAVNILAVCTTVFDKLSSKVHGRRVPEASLLMLSALGGSAAMYITMLIIRHKTRHLKFMVGIPLIFCVQSALALLFFFVWFK